ncbi:hypothetical protein AAMO2058_000767200 [Amorphochlora amoebiformis]
MSGVSGRTTEGTIRFRFRWVNTVDETRNLIILTKDMDLVDGLREMQRKSEEVSNEYANYPLVCNQSNNATFFTYHTILQGQIGCATYYGRTHFLPPGNYSWLGVSTTLHEIRDVDTDKKGGKKAGTLLNWKDVSYVCLPENHIAVIQMGPNQLCIGSGRYLIRRPVTLYGIVDIQKLKHKVTAIGIDEDVVGGKEAQKRVTMSAGEWQKCGSLTFIRAQPGFASVVQNPDGTLIHGIGFTVARGGQVFKNFIDLQHYARTTRPFYLESKDRQEMLVRVQIRWCIIKPTIWLERKGAYTDIFDAIEEIMQSLLRDYMARHTYEQCRKQQAEGYKDFESHVRPICEHEMAELGGELLGFEVRSVRFPLLEKRNTIRAQKEAKLKEQLLEEKRALDIENEERKREQARIDGRHRNEIRQQEHLVKLEALQSEQDKQKQAEEAKLRYATARSKAKQQQVKLEAELRQVRMRQEVLRNKAVADADRRISVTRARCEQNVAIVQANADATVAEADAKASAIIKAAEAQAKAAELIGQAYKSNPQFLDFKLSELKAKVMKMRADAIAKGLSQNKGVMVPIHLQNEISQMKGSMADSI